MKHTQRGAEVRIIAIIAVLTITLVGCNKECGHTSGDLKSNGHKTNRDYSDSVNKSLQTLIDNGAIIEYGDGPKHKTIVGVVFWSQLRPLLNDQDLACLGDLPDLRKLDCSFNKITGRGLVHLKGIHKLKELSVGYTYVSGDSLRHLKHLNDLEVLDLSGTKIGDSGLEHLRSLKKLRSLDLSHTKVTGKGLEFLKHMHSLDELYLKGLAISDNELPFLRCMNKISVLDMSSTGVTDVGLQYLASMYTLRRLDLENTIVTGKGFLSLKSLTKIEVLNLHKTRLNDEGISHICIFPHLHTLSMGSTQVTDMGVDDSSKIKTLLLLQIVDSFISTSSVETLKLRLPKCKIHHRMHHACSRILQKR